jgi:MFS family permease
MAILAHLFAAGGLVGLAIFPKIMPPLWGLLLAEATLGIGGGFTEVIISPLMEACPTEEKSGNMSLLHSFYCWGQAGVVLLSGIYFHCFEISASWYYLPIIWAIIPIIGAVAFSFVPIYNLPTEKGERSAVGRLFRTPLFLVFFLMMFCAGAGEMVMSQWASAFVESALGIDKTLGDLLGPCMFAIMMGIARVLYGRLSGRVDLTKWMMWGCAGCIVAYLLAAFAPHPILALIGCALCGFSVGVFWPGTLSHAAANIPLGGVSMFAVLAVAGDIGCLSGPYLSGVVADAFGQDLRAAFVFATIFPLICLAVLLLQKKKDKEGIKK